MLKVTNGEKTRTVKDAHSIPSGYWAVDNSVFEASPTVEVSEPEMDFDEIEQPTEEE